MTVLSWYLLGAIFTLVVIRSMELEYDDKDFTQPPCRMDDGYMLTLMASVGLWPAFWYGLINTLLNNRD